MVGLNSNPSTAQGTIITAVKNTRASTPPTMQPALPHVRLLSSSSSCLPACSPSPPAASCLPIPASSAPQSERSTLRPASPHCELARPHPLRCLPELAGCHRGPAAKKQSPSSGSERKINNIPSDTTQEKAISWVRPAAETRTGKLSRSEQASKRAVTYLSSAW